MSETLLMRQSESCADMPLRVGKALDAAAFNELRTELLLDCCKWDPQVGDVSTLAPFPLILPRSTWRQLAEWSEALAAEALDAERELLARPEMQARLAVPPPIRRVLARARCPQADRIMRFDFHWTTSGWRISEANADVPGGFTESSSFAKLMCAHYSEAQVAGNPAETWAAAIARSAGPGGTIALLVAPGYMEDQQIVAHLARLLRRRGVTAHVCQPRHLRWRDGLAGLGCEWHRGPISTIVRFYQAEWLPALGRRGGWENLFTGAVPVANPGSCMLIESKRFPLVWKSLTVPLPRWKQLLPETRDPRDVNWRQDDEWVLKAAFCNTGDEVAIRSVLPARQWKKFSRSVRWQPGRWEAQRRFDAIAIATPLGAMRPCIGVYTINGRAAGIYGRITPNQVIDYAAIDIAVLVEGRGREAQA